MLTREEAQRLAAKVLSYSSFSECTVFVGQTEESYTRFANNGITNAGFSERRSIVINSTREQKTGVIRVDETDDDQLRAAVKRSEELAAIAPPNPEHQPPPGPQKYPDIAAYDEETARARSPQMIPQVRAVVEAASAKKLVAAGLFERNQSTEAVANKAGLFGYTRSADARMSTTIRYPDGSSSGWAGQPAAHIRDIKGAALAAVAIEKCIKWRNPKRLEPGKYTVVFEPTAAGDIVRLILGGGGFGGGFAGPFSARATEEGRTFLSKKGGGTLLGEKLFPEFITLRSDPADPRQPSLPWSNDLLPNRPVTWINKGVIQSLQYDRYWAARTGHEPTPSPSTLIMDGGDASIEDLIKGVERGLLVTHFWYIRFVNQQTVQHTGLTRDGLFLLEDGKIKQPVMNFRFNDSPVNLLKNAVKLGRPVRVRGLEGGQMIVPAIVSTDFSFTSISDAV
ncbi:MAG: TldD/PmbA family protein [Acidobacteriota bacterium]|nr:TldD/PmbA family protein [Acidobacteriota bacterium]